MPKRKGNINKELCALLLFLILSGNLDWSPKMKLSMKEIPVLKLPSLTFPKPCKSFCLPAKFHRK